MHDMCNVKAKCRGHANLPKFTGQLGTLLDLCHQNLESVPFTNVYFDVYFKSTNSSIAKSKKTHLALI